MLIDELDKNIGNPLSSSCRPHSGSSITTPLFITFYEVFSIEAHSLSI
jgi:hypothetical protein